MKLLAGSASSLLFGVLVVSGVRFKEVVASDNKGWSIDDPTAQYKYTEDRRQLQNHDETIILFFDGTVLNDLGAPISGAQVQFWHTDKHGVYNHPRDLSSRGNPQLVPDFQYFGTSTSDSEGNFDFITYRPGLYVSRPITHIHFKVFVDGAEVLTSQLYFADESSSLQYSRMLVLELEPVLPQSTDDATIVEYYRTQSNVSSSSTMYFHTNKTIVIDMNLGGTMETTPAQTEGPFYPVVDFFHLGNDLTQPIITSDAQRTDAPSSSSASGSPTSVLSFPASTFDPKIYPFFSPKTWMGCCAALVAFCFL
ncbi:intradiol ring-cleavage dioxygenase [Nitzschia inconspicua]|uniref:Intradiol ring-cleavage dioxygenase n=1 Tax=Nitzschia inconspicua TaxID=303405 RepID=A0A9K3LXG8_9STRA|nr:intradiol ring-cleavage dioxygenase [Nitzschia inconspicua]